jgi:hypothetical protein
MKRDYDADKIVNLLRDIRRNHLGSDSAWRPWVEGNDRAFRDPEILPEVRLLAEAYLERNPMNAHVIETLAEVEDEEHLVEFLGKYTTPFDCSARALMFERYFRRGDAEKFEPERRYQLFKAIDTLFSHRYLLKKGANEQDRYAADQFAEDFLAMLRGDAIDDDVDMWIVMRLEQGINSAARSIALGKQEKALAKIAKTVKLLEATMRITDEVLLPTSCRYLDGMAWYAKEDWMSPDNNPDSPDEKMVFVETKMDHMSSCYCIFPRDYYDELRGKDFEAFHGHPEFEQLCERVKALILVRAKEV